jgi:hypothetical protein
LKCKNIFDDIKLFLSKITNLFFFFALLSKSSNSLLVSCHIASGIKVTIKNRYFELLWGNKPEVKNALLQHSVTDVGSDKFMIFVML